MSPTVKLQQSQSIDFVRLLSKPGSTFMPGLMNEFRNSARSVKRNARDTIQNTGYDTKYSTESSWRAPNLNGVPVYICYQPTRVKCPEHGVRTEYIPWADGRSRFTADFSNEIAWMVCRMSRSAVALFEDIDWRTVGNCVKAAHDRIEPDITARMHGLRRICVDETSYRKGPPHMRR